MDESKDDNNYKLLDYRLTQIEMAVKSVQTALADLNDKMLLLMPFQSRVRSLEEQLEKLEKRISIIEKEPIERDAKKWEKVFDWVFKTIVLACIGLILAKVGLN